ncbi:hypothetical protein FC814_08555 [Escherichia sp. MR]|nr:hypothetical protein [Escherichia sp. MR]TKT83230.1 hypothetical protein FC814_08555 [Escherichia sp. MR]
METLCYTKWLVRHHKSPRVSH